MINIEVLIKETTHTCMMCGEVKTRFITRVAKKPLRMEAVDLKGKKWRDNKCPECSSKYKTQWARRKYREKVLNENKLS